VTSHALLLIDLQRGMFTSRLIPPVWGGEELLARVHDLLVRARSSGVPVIHVQHAGPPGHPLERGTEAWEVHPDVAPLKGERVVVKETPDAFHETDLHSHLLAERVKAIAVAGIQTELCVDTTCRRAFSLGYRVTLAADAHSTWDSESLRAPQIIQHHNRLLELWFAQTQLAEAIRFAPPGVR
jgi:nicotinamidase-related amidase